MDGCSKDDTLDLVRAYKDEHIHLYSEPDKGIYDAMNKGVLRAKGDWLYFLGSDDYLYAPDVLEKVSKELVLEYEIVYGEVEASQLQAEYRGEWRPDMLEYNRCHQAIFYHRSVFEKYGVYDMSYKVYADYIYNLRCFWKYKVSTKYMNVVVAHYSDGGVSAKGNDPKFYRDIDLLILRYGSRNYSINRKKEFAYNVIRHNDDIARRFAMRMYIYYLRVVAKLKRTK
jgi:glycosyltransferase involved in cell wall biosynthesis